MDVLTEIEYEIDKLSSCTYRDEQGIWAEPKQLMNMKKLFSRARNMKVESVLDFTRAVSDLASRESKISQLALELYKISKK